MVERLVDVLNAEKLVLHVFPITVAEPRGAAADIDFQRKAHDAAAFAHLVPDPELNALSERMHISRSGPLEPYGDERDVLCQTKQDLDRTVRERAYFLWQRDGCPEGRQDRFWYGAEEQHLRERAYGLWEREGRIEGRAAEHWQRTRNFQAT